MIVECAWCGCIVGEKDGQGLEGTTSGICGACFAVICREIPGEGSEAEPAEGAFPR